MRSVYLRLRRRIPETWVRFLRRQPILRRVARRFQPVDYRVYSLAGPLRGYRMALPTNAGLYEMVWGTYEPNGCATILKTVRSGMRVLDIGAFVGYFSLLLKKQVGMAGEVICFEPLPENRLLLHRNLELNGLAGAVRIEPMAVTDSVALMILQLGQTPSQAYLQSTPTPGVQSLIVPTCDLDTYCRMSNWPSIHFIKMDIEGAESRAVRGMSEVISRYHPSFLLEAHGEAAREGLLYLQSQGYYFERWKVQGEPLPVDWLQPIGHEHWHAWHAEEQIQ